MWIPKYRYKLFNIEGNRVPEQEIEIEFGTTNTVDSETECIATNKSGDNGTCENGKWMTHPAFTSLDVTGLWVGKFETGYKGSTDKESAQKNENAPEKVQIKPNVNSWRSINVSNAYNTSYNYKRSLDSHMMKNTEWGAIVYLTNSKYGRGNSEVWINNSSTFTTGCAGSSVSASSYNGCQNAWNTAIGYHASTTDNISGIYDTSGGAWEYVMGSPNNIQSSEILNPSNVPDKYIDRYKGSNINYKILGDATGETNRWNEDWPDFAADGSWFMRGGPYDSTTGSGIFAYNYNIGGDVPYFGFRVVLT